MVSEADQISVSTDEFSQEQAFARISGFYQTYNCIEELDDEGDIARANALYNSFNSILELGNVTPDKEEALLNLSNVMRGESADYELAFRGLQILQGTFSKGIIAMVLNEIENLYFQEL